MTARGSKFWGLARSLSICPGAAGFAVIAAAIAGIVLVRTDPRPYAEQFASKRFGRLLAIEDLTIGGAVPYYQTNVAADPLPAQFISVMDLHDGALTFNTSSPNTLRLLLTDVDFRAAHDALILLSRKNDLPPNRRRREGNRR